MSTFSNLENMILVFFLSFFFIFNLGADESGSNSYRERFSKAPSPADEGSLKEGKEDGFGGGPKRGKFGKKKKKKDDFRRVVGPRDPIVPVTGVETGDLTAVTYKSPTPTAPLLEKAWNSTAWAPTYQPASRSLLGEKGDLSSVIQSDLIKHTGWKVDGDSISVSPDLNGGPYDVETGQAITFTVDRETSVDFLGMPGRVASAMTWDNPISLLGPYNPFKLARKNSLKNPYGIVQSGRRLLNRAGVLSAWAFEEGGVQITEDGGIGIVHDPSGKEALLAGAGIALWFTPIKIGPMLSAGTRVLPGASRALTLAASFGRGAWGRATSAVNQFGHWAAGASGRLGRGVWSGMEAIARASHSSGLFGGGAMTELLRFTGRLLAQVGNRGRGSFFYQYTLRALYNIKRGLLYTMREERSGVMRQERRFRWDWLYAPGWLDRVDARQRAVYYLAQQLPAHLARMRVGDRVLLIDNPSRRLVIFLPKGEPRVPVYIFRDLPRDALIALNSRFNVVATNLLRDQRRYMEYVRTNNITDDILAFMSRISGFSQREVQSILAVFSRSRPMPRWWTNMMK